MKICVVVDDYLPESTRVGAKMMHELCVEFASRGHTVTVVTPQQGAGILIELQTLDGVLIRPFRSGATKNVPKWKRAINESLLPAQAWRAHRDFFRSNPHDLIVYYSPCIFWGPLVRRLKRLWGAPSYLVLRDFFPQWAIDNGMLREGSLLTRYFRHCEGTSYGAADMIGIQSPRNLTAFRSAYPHPQKTEVLYNWAADRPLAKGSWRYRAELGLGLGLELGQKVIFFYGGAITNQQDIPNLLRLAEKMKGAQNAHFLIVGEGYEVAMVREIIRERALTNVTLLPPVSQEEFREMLTEVDVGLFSLAKSHTTHNFPGKLLGYMVQGIPILGSVNAGNDLQVVVESASAGLIAVNGDDDRLAHNALLLLEDPALRERLGDNARRLLESTFSVRAAADTIEKASSTKRPEPE